MNTLLILLTALFPIFLLAFYIFYKDRKSSEPPKLLAKACLFGIISVPLSLCVSIPLEGIGVYSDEATSILGRINCAFWGAAIPEEIAKFVMLWLLLRKNPYFDEKMDGIVYAVCVSLGFAAIENILYLFSDTDSFLSVGIARAIFAVPGHFCFGILMGYYYSLAKFYPQSSNKNKILVLVAPIIAHGLYDAILFVAKITVDIVSGVLLIAFWVFCHKQWRYCGKRIREHLHRDDINQ